MRENMEFSTGTPTKTAMYLVDRGMQGKYYRWFDADAGTWSMCGADMKEAVSYIGRPSPVGFFPWVGPLTGPLFDPTAEIVEVNDEVDKPIKKEKKAKVKKVPTNKVKLVITQVGNTKVGSIVKSSGKTIHPDGTVFYREDRQKWVAMMNGKQEAARPTAEACLAFLKKKYNVEGIVLK
jgi:hypothetical protein